MSWHAWCPPDTWPANAPSVRWHRLTVAGGHEVRLWLFSLDEPACDATPLTDCLDQHERARAERFRQVLHARRHRVARAVLRHLLGQQRQQPAADLAWDLGPHGKPSMAPSSPCTPASPHFNLTHSAGWALLATSPTLELGIDLEERRSRAHLAGMAERIFSPAERHGLPDDGPRASVDVDLLLRAWVRKEACLKATGLGLNREMATIVLQHGQALAAPGCPDLPPLPAICWSDVTLPDDCPALASCAWLSPL